MPGRADSLAIDTARQTSGADPLRPTLRPLLLVRERTERANDVAFLLPVGLIVSVFGAVWVRTG